MSQTDLGRRAWSALGWGYAGAFGRVMLQFIVQVILARLLGPESFGLAAATLTVLGLGWLFAEGGFGAALVQRPVLTPADVSYALGWVLLISGLTGLLVVLCAPALAALFGQPELVPLFRVCGLLIPLQAASNIPASLMRRDLDLKRSQLIYLGSYVVAYGGFGVALAFAGGGAWSLVGAFALQTALSFAASWAIVRHTWRPSLRGDGALRRFGLKVTATNLANWAIENLDRVLVSRLWGTAPLGEYVAAASLSRAPVGVLVSTVQGVAFASAARIQEDPPRVARVYLAALNLLSLVACPFFAGLACHADAVLHLLYGEKWLGAIPLFAAFCVGMPFMALLSVAGPLLWALDGVRKEMNGQLLALLVLVTGLSLMSALPLGSAVWFVTFVYALRWLWVHLALARATSIPWHQTWRAARGGLGLAAMVVLVSLAAQTVLAQPTLAFAATALAAAALWLLALRLAAAALVGPDLRRMVSNRAADSPLVAALCRYARFGVAT